METNTESVELVGEEVAGNVARAALFAALVGAFAYVVFPNPLSPGVPVTLQVLGVFLAGIFLGPVWGFAALVLYLVAGVAGVPVFHGGASSLGHLLGPTAGFLLSYPFAAAVVGLFVHGPRELGDPTAVSVPRLVGAMVAGTVVVYAFGTVGYAVVQDVTLQRAVVAAALVFLPAEALKVAAAVGVVRSDAVAVG